MHMPVMFFERYITRHFMPGLVCVHSKGLHSAQGDIKMCTSRVNLKISPVRL